MHDLRQIIRDNGGDNTPALDTHNLTGRAFPEGVEPEWTPLDAYEDEDAWYESHIGYFDVSMDVLSYESWLGSLDCE